MPEQLGTAELQLSTDQAPLIAGLAEAEARVAKSVAVMQAMLDKLHADIEGRVGLLDTLATKAAAASTGPGSATPPPGTTSGGRGNDVWGIRGPEHPGSMTNPIVTVIEAAKYTPMGSYAAAIGESNVQDEQQGDQQSGLASAADMAALTAAVQDLARETTPASRLAKAGIVGVAEPGAAERTVVSLDAADRMLLQRIADAVEPVQGIPGAAGQPGAPGESGRTIIIDKTSGAPRQGAERIFVGGPGGGGESSASTISGPGGFDTFRLDGGQYAGLISAILESHGGGASSLAKRVDVFYHSSTESGGAGGELAGAAGGAGIGGILSMLGLGKGFAGLSVPRWRGHRRGIRGTWP